MKSLIPNGGKPMFSPDLKSMPSEEFSVAEKMAVMSELNLIDTMSQWHSQGSNLGDNYKELAIIYASLYDDKIAMSNMLLIFKGAVVSLEVERKKYVDKNGDSERTDDAYKRNQMMMRVHKEFSYSIERDQQIMIMLKNYADLNHQLKKENETLKQQLKNIEAAETF